MAAVSFVTKTTLLNKNEANIFLNFHYPHNTPIVLSLKVIARLPAHLLLSASLLWNDWNDTQVRVVENELDLSSESSSNSGSNRISRWVFYWVSNDPPGILFYNLRACTHLPNKIGKHDLPFLCILPYLEKNRRRFRQQLVYVLSLLEILSAIFFVWNPWRDECYLYSERYFFVNVSISASRDVVVPSTLHAVVRWCCNTKHMSINECPIPTLKVCKAMISTTWTRFIFIVEDYIDGSNKRSDISCRRAVLCCMSKYFINKSRDTINNIDFPNQSSGSWWRTRTYTIRIISLLRGMTMEESIELWWMRRIRRAYCLPFVVGVNKQKRKLMSGLE